MVEFLDMVPHMSMVPTRIIKELPDVDRRLAQLALDRPTLLKVREIALSAAADATAFHPANAAGTFAYQHGTWGLRDSFVGKVWNSERPGGVEVIHNPAIKLMVAYANVDVACDDDHSPKPRSRKGGGAERAAMGSLFASLPRYSAQPKIGERLYYLMVAESGAAELSLPVVKENTFISCVERIYLSNGDDLDRIARSFDDGDVADGFDPLVARK
jgi:hypothetical protein